MLDFEIPLSILLVSIFNDTILICHYIYSLHMLSNLLSRLSHHLLWIFQPQRKTFSTFLKLSKHRHAHVSCLSCERFLVWWRDKDASRASPQGSREPCALTPQRPRTYSNKRDARNNMPNLNNRSSRGPLATR